MFKVNLEAEVGFKWDRMPSGYKGACVCVHVLMVVKPHCRMCSWKPELICSGSCLGSER